MYRIIGIDPGSRITGYGIIDVEYRTLKFVEAGCIRVKSEAIPERLAEIFQTLADVIRQFEPNKMAIEKVFMHRNADSALKLGQARGAAICAAHTGQLNVHEFSANEIKKAVVGYGHADKNQMQFMVKNLLKISQDLQEDSADGLSAAICLAYHLGTQDLKSRR